MKMMANKKMSLLLIFVLLLTLAIPAVALAGSRHIDFSIGSGDNYLERSSSFTVNASHMHLDVSAWISEGDPDLSDGHVRVRVYHDGWYDSLVSEEDCYFSTTNQWSVSTTSGDDYYLVFDKRTDGTTADGYANISW